MPDPKLPSRDQKVIDNVFDARKFDQATHIQEIVQKKDGKNRFQTNTKSGDCPYSKNGRTGIQKIVP
jgi:hypothetical protein